MAALSRPLATWRPGPTRSNLFAVAPGQEQRERATLLPSPDSATDADPLLPPGQQQPCGLSRQVLDAAGLCACDSPTALIGAAKRALLALGHHLAQQIGADGYRALLSRALELAAADYPFLASVHPTADQPPGRLAGLPRSPRRTTPRELQLALTLTLAKLVQVLGTLVGDDLTRRLLSEVWPRLVAPPARASRGQVGPTGG